MGHLLLMRIKYPNMRKTAELQRSYSLTLFPIIRIEHFKTDVGRSAVIPKTSGT